MEMGWKGKGGHDEMVEKRELHEKLANRWPISQAKGAHK